MLKIKYLIIVVVFLIVAVFLVFFGSNLTTHLPNSNHKIQIVAAENFWGSLVSQLGGNKVSVTSLITDPNSDPHQFEVSPVDARLFADANYVILNGAGYDSWASSMIAANTNSSRIVLNVANLLGKKNGDNPHFWYNPSYVNTVVLKMKNDLIKIDPNDSQYFNSQYNLLLSKLAVYQDRLTMIKKKFNGYKVGSTESIFVYMASASGLDLISPASFMQAVADGNDPPINSVVDFQNQITSHQIKLLVYNSQTITPLTANIKNLALANHIPIVPITETIQPANLTFQDWMNNQLIAIEKAL